MKANIPQRTNCEINLVTLAREMGRDKVFMLSDVEKYLSLTKEEVDPAILQVSFTVGALYERLMVYCRGAL